MKNMEDKDMFAGIINEFARLLNQLGLAWWVEVVTGKPRCTYYFGPFTSADEAKASQTGYVEDLEREGAQGITVAVKRCKPKTLTVYEESDPNPASSLAGQLR